MEDCAIFNLKLLKKGTYEAELKECRNSILTFPSHHTDGIKISKFKLSPTIAGEDIVRKIIFQDGSNLCKLGRRFKRCEEITIGNGIKIIPARCFEYMFSLKLCAIAPDVEIIEEKAFYSSRQLCRLEIPEDTKLTYIGEGAFESTESSVIKPLLNNCIQYNDFYYLPSKSNPYFCLLLASSDEYDVIVNPKCELIYNATGFVYHQCLEHFFTLRELINHTGEDHISKIKNWVINGDFLEIDDISISLDEAIRLKYPSLIGGRMSFGMRGYRYYLQKGDYNIDFLSEATICIPSYLSPNGFELEIGTVNVLSDARLYNLLLWK